MVSSNGFFLNHHRQTSSSTNEFLFGRWNNLENNDDGDGTVMDKPDQSSKSPSQPIVEPPPIEDSSQISSNNNTQSSSIINETQSAASSSGSGPSRWKKRKLEAEVTPKDSAFINACQALAKPEHERRDESECVGSHIAAVLRNMDAELRRRKQKKLMQVLYDSD